MCVVPFPLTLHGAASLHTCSRVKPAGARGCDLLLLALYLLRWELWVSVFQQFLRFLTGEQGLLRPGQGGSPVGDWFMPPHSNLAELNVWQGVCLQGSTGLLLISQAQRSWLGPWVGKGHRWHPSHSPCKHLLWVVPLVGSEQGRRVKCGEG